VRKRRQEFILDASCALSLHTRASLGFQHLLALQIDKLQSFGPLGVRQIAGEIGVAEEATGIVAKGTDNDIGPKLRAILAHTPAVFNKATLFRSYL
jgi:hypothetical protein